MDRRVQSWSTEEPKSVLLIVQFSYVICFIGFP